MLWCWDQRLLCCAFHDSSHPHRVYLPYFHVGLSCIPRLSFPSRTQRTQMLGAFYLLRALETLDQINQHGKAAIPRLVKLYIRHTTEYPEAGIIILPYIFLSHHHLYIYSLVTSSHWRFPLSRILHGYNVSLVTG